MKILVLGCNGQLGREIMALLARQTQIAWLGLCRADLDLTHTLSIQSTLARFGHFDWIINAAAYTAVDQAETEPALADTVNHLAVREIAQFAAAQKTKVLHFSTDYVFNGKARQPYTETDSTQPVNVYGHTKLAGERALQQYQPEHIIIRTSWVFSAHGQNFLKTVLRLCQSQSVLNIVHDQCGTPTAAQDLARVSLAVCMGNIKAGLYHYCSGKPSTWYEFACTIRQSALRWGDLLCQNINAIQTRNYPTLAQRPLYSVLDTRKIQSAGIAVQPWQAGVDETIDRLLQASDA